MCVERIQGANTAAAAGTDSLASFLARAGGGDLATEYQALFSRDAGLQFRAGRAGVRIQQRRVAEARRLRFEALQRYQQAMREKSFWSRLADTFGKIFGALTVAVGLLGGPVGAVSAAGVLCTGGMKLASAGFGVSAAKAQAAKMTQEAEADQGRAEQESWQQLLEQAVRFEADMVKHVRRVCEEETGARLG